MKGLQTFYAIAADDAWPPAPGGRRVLYALPVLVFKAAERLLADSRHLICLLLLHKNFLDGNFPSGSWREEVFSRSKQGEKEREQGGQGGQGKKEPLHFMVSFSFNYKKQQGLQNWSFAILINLKGERRKVAKI